MCLSVADIIIHVNGMQVPCIFGVNLSDVDLLEFLQQVIYEVFLLFEPFLFSFLLFFFLYLMSFFLYFASHS